MIFIPDLVIFTVRTTGILLYKDHRLTRCDLESKWVWIMVWKVRVVALVFYPTSVIIKYGLILIRLYFINI